MFIKSTHKVEMSKFSDETILCMAGFPLCLAKDPSGSQRLQFRHTTVKYDVEICRVMDVVEFLS